MAVLDLNKICAEPLEVKIGTKIYKITDPGLSGIIKTVRQLEKIASQKNPEKDIDIFTKTVRDLTPAIPDKIFQSLTMEQVIALFNKIGEHFMGEERINKSPLANRAQRRKTGSKKARKKSALH